MSLEERSTSEEIDDMLTEIKDVMQDLTRAEKFELIGLISV